MPNLDLGVGERLAVVTAKAQSQRQGRAESAFDYVAPTGLVAAPVRALFLFRPEMAGGRRRVKQTRDRVADRLVRPCAHAAVPFLSSWASKASAASADDISCSGVSMSPNSRQRWRLG